MHKNKRINVRLLSTSLMVVSVLLGLAYTNVMIARASPVTGFNAGHIIDDSVFTNRSSMSASQIQTFLNSKVPVCDTNGTQPSEYGGGTRAQYGAARGNPAPFICLKDYSEGGRSSAQIIYDASQEFSINPQVLIVLLQKEQGLVTDTWPFAVQYRSATGYGCPDTAACDSQYYGLTNQIRWSARMFRAIINNSPGWYTPYVLGNNFIQWSPNSACGGSNVNIENRSTQALYNYTPYQPNQAALNAGYGTGDGCSAYGNRNFYLYFTDWFGSTTGPDYAASFKSQQLYSDSSMTSLVPFINGLYVTKPNQKVYAKVEAVNTGRAQWNTFTNLGTARPQDRVSVFKDTSWLSSQRAAHLETSPVNPSGVGTYKFSMTIPSQTGGYSESFGVVQDGVVWTNDIVTLPIITTTPRPYSSNYTEHILGGVKKTLFAGETLLSPDLYTSLSLTRDGKLTLRKDFSIAWQSPSAGSDAYLVMQADGNLVLYNKSNTPVWHTQTNGKGTSNLYVQEDGNLVLYNSTGATWASGTGYPISHINFTTSNLPSDGVIHTGQGLETPDRRYGLYLQGDGNLVLYSPNRATWASNTVGSNASYLILQSDGNLVLYSKSGSAVWNSGTAGRGISSFSAQADGNLVIYNNNGPTWNSGTNGRQ